MEILSFLKNLKWPLDSACPETNKKKQQVFGGKIDTWGLYFKKKTQLFRVFFDVFFLGVFLNKKFAFLFLIIFLFWLVRINSLGADINNNDSTRWFVRSGDFLQALKDGNFQNTSQTIYGSNHNY